METHHKRLIFILLFYVLSAHRNSRKTFIPFRDDKLTFFLKESFGGNGYDEDIDDHKEEEVMMMNDTVREDVYIPHKKGFYYNGWYLHWNGLLYKMEETEGCDH